MRSRLAPMADSGVGVKDLVGAVQTGPAGRAHPQIVLQVIEAGTTRCGLAGDIVVRYLMAQTNDHAATVMRIIVIRKESATKSGGWSVVACSVAHGSHSDPVNRAGAQGALAQHTDGLDDEGLTLKVAAPSQAGPAVAVSAACEIPMRARVSDRAGRPAARHPAATLPTSPSLF